MRQARALLPYAVSALVVVAASTLALAYAVIDERDLRVAREATPSATPAGTRAFAELSASGRLAYWRTDPASGSGELFVSNVDGSMRRSIGRIDHMRRASLTRWVRTGDAVAYVEGGSALVHVDLDGAVSVLRVRADSRAAGYTRIVDHRWSGNGRQVAATVVRADLRSDVFVGAVGAPDLVPMTTIEDAFASDWLDAQHVLICTGGGIVGVLDVTAPANAVRPLVGVPATSPILAADGRIHFLVGSVSPSPRDSTLPYLTATGATVWSTSADGGDLRQETRTLADDLRLDARYAEGHYLAHRGSSSVQVLLGDTVAVPPIDAGAVERAVVASDGRSAIGFTSSRMIRFDVGRSERGAFGRPSVVLDLVGGGDVWFPRTFTMTASARPSGAVPQARYALPLGGHLWLMGSDGVASFLRMRSPQTGRRAVPLPAWSPDGQRLLTIELAGTALPGVGASTPIAVTIDPQGRVTRYDAARAATGVPSWAPDGSAFAVVVDARGIDPFGSAAELEARFLTLDGRVARDAVRARDAVWTRAGILTLTEREIGLAATSGGAPRTVIDIATVLADPRGEFPQTRESVTIGALTASPDGAFATFRLNVSPVTGASRIAIAVVSVRGSSVATYLPGSTVSDVSWSPTAARLGYTVSTTATPRSSAPQSADQSAQVRDVASDRVIASWPGRFAGWSPDGEWALVARNTGLYAHRIASGDGVQVSTIGVPVSATALR